MRGVLTQPKSLKTVALALMVVFGSVFAVPNDASASPATDESAFLRDMNSLRASRGLAGFQRNAALDTVARNWANQMAARGSLVHNPNLSKQAPAGWRKLGENVGVGGTEPTLFAAFVASPGHFANLVDPQFNNVGIAVVYSGGRMWTVHVFMAGATVSTPGNYGQSEAARYLQAMAARMPAARRSNTLIGLTATGRS